MKALIDADILRYELGYASETGWKAIKEDVNALPPFDYVEDMLLERIESIARETKSDSYSLYLTEGPSFRDALSVTKPYKGNRKSAKPWHYSNLTVYLTDVLGATVCEGLEADDVLTITHLEDIENTIICSRDKDLRQVPGWSYGWELGRQASFGPEKISKVGTLNLSQDNKKLTGTGFAFFCAQVLTGDSVDNIAGLPGCGPKGAFDMLEAAWVSYGCSPEKQCEEYLAVLTSAYQAHYGHDWEDHLLEMGRLCWMVRRLNEDGSPVLWNIGDIE